MTLTGTQFIGLSFGVLLLACFTYWAGYQIFTSVKAWLKERKGQSGGQHTPNPQPPPAK